MDRLYKREILFGIDGAGSFFKDADTPNIDRIFKNGAVTYNGVTSIPSISAECWGSMLCGVDPQFHKMTNSTVSAEKADSNSNHPSFFRIIREKYPNAVMASFCTWDAINYGIVENDIGVYKFNGNEQEVTENVIRYIENTDFDVLYVMYEEADLKGHHNGYGSEAHLRQISLNDRYIGAIYDALERHGLVEDTLFVLSTDHGGTPYGNHGGDTPEEMKITVAASGKGIKKCDMNGNSRTSIKSVAAIMLYGMGIGIPETWNAVVPDNIFENYIEQEKTKVSDRQQITEEILNDGLIRTPIWFEGSMLEYMNHDLVETVGEISFCEGIKREAADFSKGYILLKKYKVGIDNFSVGIRIKYSDFTHNEILFSNSNAQRDTACGYNALLTENGVTFRLGNGEFGQKFEFGFSHKPNEWFSFIVSIDRKNNKVSAYFNYEKIGEYEICEKLRKSTLDSLDFAIGMDGMEEFPYHLEALLSELYIFRIALNEEDIQKVKKYYD